MYSSCGPKIWYINLEHIACDHNADIHSVVNYS